MMSLSARLKSTSSNSHRSAEQHPFLKNLFTGNLSPNTYLSYLLQLDSAYSALEQNLSLVPELSALANRFGLFRCNSIKDDVLYFKNTYNLPEDPTVAHTLYADHLMKVSKEYPRGLVSHFYTRYLGDLSGGQILKRYVQKAFSETSLNGTSFYQFDDIESPRDAVMQIKQVLDSLQLTEDEVAMLEDECITAFKLSESMFDAAMASEITTTSVRARQSSSASLR